MSKLNFLALLETLSKKELKDFELFLNGIYRPETKPLILFIYLKKYYPAFDHPNDLKAKHIEQKLFKINSSNHPVSNFMSQLYGSLNDFLLLQHLRTKNIFQRDLLLNQIYRERNIENLFIQKLEATKKQLYKTGHQDMWFFYNRLRLEHLKYFSPAYSKYKDANSSINELEGYLDQFFIHAKLLYRLESKYRSLILSDKKSTFKTPSNELDVFLKNKPILPIPELLINLTKAMPQVTLNKFQTLRKEVFQKIHLISQKDRSIYYNFLLNYAAYGIKQGLNGFNQELLEVHKFGLEKQIAFDGQLISHHLFLNIIDIAANFETVAWIKSFIKTYKKFLPDSSKEQTLLLAEARLFLKQNRYEQVSKKLIIKQYNEKFFKIRSNILLIQAYYEKRDWDLMDTTVENFKKYTSRNKKSIGNLTVSAITNFVTFVLLLKDEPFKKKGFQFLKNELEQYQAIFNLTWLNQKLNQIKK